MVVQKRHPLRGWQRRRRRARRRRRWQCLQAAPQRGRRGWAVRRRAGRERRGRRWEGRLLVDVAGKVVVRLGQIVQPPCDLRAVAGLALPRVERAELSVVGDVEQIDGLVDHVALARNLRQGKAHTVTVLTSEEGGAVARCARWVGREQLRGAPRSSRASSRCPWSRRSAGTAPWAHRERQTGSCRRSSSAPDEATMGARDETRTLGQESMRLAGARGSLQQTLSETNSERWLHTHDIEPSAVGTVSQPSVLYSPNSSLK